MESAVQAEQRSPRHEIVNREQVATAPMLMDKAWEEIQQKTFTKWVNTKLAVRNNRPISNLMTDLSDGVVLIQLLEVIGDTSLGKYNKNCKMRIQKVENMNKALEFIKQRGVNLTNIGAEDIVDSNHKLILGMIWTIILRFTIADITEEGLSAKEGLLLWAQRKTAPYHDVHVKDFTFSWQDGLAFCALIHRHRPDLLDYHALDKSDRHANTRLAFDVAAQHLNIPRLLDVEDLCDIAKPDERSVMTYVAEYFHAFSALDKNEVAGRRVGKFAEVMQSVWEMQNDYERRATLLLQQMANTKSTWAHSSFNGTYVDAKRQSAELNAYKSAEKRTNVAEKKDLDTLLGNIQTKLSTYKLAPYYPPAGLTLQDLDNAWNGLVEAEAERRRDINAEIRQTKEKLAAEFARLANDCASQIGDISHQLAQLDGELESQLQTVQSLLTRISPLHDSLSEIRAADEQCQIANIEENDHTVYTVDDLDFELELVRTALTKKSGFIENQIVARSVTNMTAAQLEEFESTFRHFDKDNSNTLSKLEFKAALAGLGIMYPDNEFDQVFAKTCQGTDSVNFEQFINFAVSVTEDRTSPDQLREAFKTLGGEKGYVTDMDLRMCFLAEPVLSYLRETMPRRNNAEGQYDYNAFLDRTFNWAASHRQPSHCDFLS